MYPTRNSLPEHSRKKLVTLLQARLADLIDLQLRAKQAHWNVKGPIFLPLHGLFEEMHSALAGHADDVAERLVQLGGIALGGARVVSQMSTLAEYPPHIAHGEDHLEAMAESLAKAGENLHAAIAEASAVEDPATADLLTGILRTVDKQLWMAEAHSQDQSGE